MKWEWGFLLTRGTQSSTRSPFAILVGNVKRSIQIASVWIYLSRIVNTRPDQTISSASLTGVILSHNTREELWKGHNQQPWWRTTALSMSLMKSMPIGTINVPSKDLQWSTGREEIGRGFLISFFQKKSHRRDDLDPIPLEQISRIRSLLRKKQNPSYIRILIISDCGTVMMDMLSKLLANLAEDQLIELHYGN